jgi:16S rRNA G966 N2-methylase RsmD
MAGTFAADSKMMFYPTDLKEVYRMLSIFGNAKMHLENLEEDSALWNIWNECTSRANWYNKASTIFFDELISMGRFDVIDKLFTFPPYVKNKTNALDPFAGEGVWLEQIGRLGFTTIAIEPDKNRFEKIKSAHKVNDFLENVELPQNSVGLLLFNPPYGATNGVRNVRHYLNMLLERKLLVNNGVIVAVIRGDDAKECYDLLYDNFYISHKYRVNKEEYDKYKQYVIIGSLRSSRPSWSNYTSSQSLFNEFIDAQEDMIASEVYKNVMVPTCGDWEYLYGKIAQVKKRKGVYSKKDKAWSWLINDYDAKLDQDFKLVMPKPPKPSEIANILASGIINGEIEDHLVSGGVKKISRVEQITDEDGETKVVETKFSKPYLNILYKQNGEVKIKQIEGAQE